MLVSVCGLLLGNGNWKHNGPYWGGVATTNNNYSNNYGDYLNRENIPRLT